MGRRLGWRSAAVLVAILGLAIGVGAAKQTPPPAQSVDPVAADPSVPTLYEHANFGGARLALAPGMTDLSAVPGLCRGGRGSAGCASSLRVPPGYVVRLYSGPRTTGPSVTLWGDRSNFSSVEGPCPTGRKGDFNDCAASAHVWRFESSRTFVVSSQEGWQDTGLSVRTGDHLTFFATGKVTRRSGIAYGATPAGETSDPDNWPYRLEAGLCVHLLCDSAVPAGSLVGRIGAAGLSDVHDGFRIGSELTKVVDRSGPLRLGINLGIVSQRRDGLEPGAVWAVSGWYLVFVAVEPGNGKQR